MFLDYPAKIIAVILTSALTISIIRQDFGRIAQLRRGTIGHKLCDTTRSYPMTTISLVTGGSRGLGRNTAISIARHGGDVIFTYRKGADQARAVVAEIETLDRKAVALQLDVADISGFNGFIEQVRSTLKSWGQDSFDHLVNNAGHGEMAVASSISLRV
jgi:NADP-dependent 3-hydroxy acid dehydrogenase YdfG